MPGVVVWWWCGVVVWPRVSVVSLDFGLDCISVSCVLRGFVTLLECSYHLNAFCHAIDV